MTYKVYAHADTHTCTYTHCFISLSKLMSVSVLTSINKCISINKCSNITVCDRFWLFGGIFEWLWVVVDGCGWLHTLG